MGLGLIAIAGSALYVHDAAQVAEAQPTFASIDSVGPSLGAEPTGTVVALDDANGLVLEYDFADKNALIADNVLGGVAVPPGFRATIYDTTIASSGAFFLSFFDADTAPRHLAEGASAITETYDNCSGEPVPLLLQAEPYGQDDFSTQSELTLRYYITFELLSEC